MTSVKTRLTVNRASGATASPCSTLETSSHTLTNANAARTTRPPLTMGGTATISGSGTAADVASARSSGRTSAAAGAAKNGSRCNALTAVIPARHAQDVANNEVPTMAVGFCALVGREDGHGGRRDQLDAAGVYRQERTHGVRGRPGMRVEPFQVVHGAQAQRRGGVAQAEHVGGDVHHHRAHGGMVGRHVGKQPPHHRPQPPRQHLHQARTLRQAHDPQPHRQRAHQRQRDVHHRRAPPLQNAPLVTSSRCPAPSNTDTSTSASQM